MLSLFIYFPKFIIVLSYIWQILKPQTSIKLCKNTMHIGSTDHCQRHLIMKMIIELMRHVAK